MGACRATEKPLFQLHFQSFNMNKLPLSVFIIAKNEADRISYTLHSVKDIADEILVIDSGSTDNTKSICDEFGAKFIYNEWQGFGPQKRYGESLCKNRWILNLDADEALSAPLIEEIRNLFENQEIDNCTAYVLDVRIVLDHSQEPHPFAPNTLTARLYNKNFCGFSDSPIHDSVLVEKKNTKRLKGKVIHRCFRSLDHELSKINFYTTMQADDFCLKRRKVSKLRIIIEPFFAFFKAYLIRRYCFYGVDGLVQSFIYSFSKLIRLAKAREKQNKLD